MSVKGFLKKLGILAAGCILAAGFSSVTCMASPVSVYCFFNDSEMDSFWTTSYSEKQQLENPSNGRQLYFYSGDGWQVDTEAGGVRVPVYRFYNDTTKDHFFSTSEAEKQAIINNTRTGKDNYVYEGIAWYAYTSGSWPVYRFFDDVNFNHYYTADENEKYSLEHGDNNYRYEGIAWYAAGIGSNGGSGNGYQGIAPLTASTGGSSWMDNSSNNSKSDAEIVRLLQRALDNTYDPYGTFSVWEYGHRASGSQFYSDLENRDPYSDELWCFVGKSQGDGAIPIAHVYVNVNTGRAVFDFVEEYGFWVEDSFPSQMQLW